MSEAEFKAAKVEGPRDLPADDTARRARNIVVLAVTTSTQVIDMMGPDDGSGTPMLPKSRKTIVKLTPEVDVYYKWSDKSGATLVETATGDTTPESQCDRLYAGQPVHEYPSGRYIVVKGVAAGNLRISIASP